MATKELKTDRNGFIFHPTKVTPIAGEVKWCKIFEPDFKFNKHGERSLEFIVSPEDGELILDMLKEVKKLDKDAFKKASKGRTIKWQDFYKEDLDRDEKPTGKWSFKFKVKGNDQRDCPNVALVDSRGKVIKGLNKIGNGSLIKVAFEPHGWYTGALGGGISLKLQAVKLLDLVEYGDYDATSAFGDEDEGGFVYGEGADNEDYSQQEPPEGIVDADDDEDF